MRDFTLALLFIALAYGAVEFRRWRSPETRDLLTPPQRRRRALNLIALVLVIAMAYGGTYFPTVHVARRVAAIELAYWSICLLIAVLIPIFAVYEYRATLRQEQLLALSADRDEAIRQMVEVVAKAEGNRKRREELPQRNGHG